MSGFDDIINALDNWIDPDKRAEAMKAAVSKPEQPKNPTPRFLVGDSVVVRDTNWNGRILKRTGLYSDPGFPKLGDLDMPAAEINWQFNAELHTQLRENLIGTVEIGDKCRVIAIWFGESDKRWYYFIDNGKLKGRGWTRCDFRFNSTTP